MRKTSKSKGTISGWKSRQIVAPLRLCRNLSQLRFSRAGKTRLIALRKPRKSPRVMTKTITENHWMIHKETISTLIVKKKMATTRHNYSFLMPSVTARGVGRVTKATATSKRRRRRRKMRKRRRKMEMVMTVTVVVTIAMMITMKMTMETTMTKRAVIMWGIRNLRRKRRQLPQLKQFSNGYNVKIQTIPNRRVRAMTTT
mmetsp:Transcript_35535/g.57558  ORF Transcript_35535/g.57558 Transcript_35535/m.57558 type:complete len:200 (-) Transcript_35535:230-829(-)